MFRPGSFANMCFFPSQIFFGQKGFLDIQIHGNSGMIEYFFRDKLTGDATFHHVSRGKGWDGPPEGFKANKSKSMDRAKLQQ